MITPATNQVQSANLTIQNKGGGVAAVFIYDDIGPDWTGLIGADTIRKELANLAGITKIDLHINSRGGSVVEATAIYNLFKDHPATVNVSIDGLAASSAGWIAMAGDRITIAENGYLMLHDPTNIVAGDAGELRKAADVLDQTKGSIARTFSRRTGIGTDEIADMMTAETWLDGAAAVAKGFADDVSPNKAINCARDFDGFNNVPPAARRLAGDFTNSTHGRAQGKRQLTAAELADQALVDEMNRLMV